MDGGLPPLQQAVGCLCVSGLPWVCRVYLSNLKLSGYFTSPECFKCCLRTSKVHSMRVSSTGHQAATSARSCRSWECMGVACMRQARATWHDRGLNRF